MEPIVVDGIYEDGKIELAEQPAGILRARVRVTFLPGSDTAEKADAREAARQRALARMNAGINFGGEKFNREEIYEERMRELDERREAGERLLASMQKGLNFGGEKFNREEVYEERMRDLESRRTGQ